MSMVNLGHSGHLSIFTLLKHLMMLLKYNFSGLHFYTLPKTLIPFRTMQLRFFLSETLLNNAFKVSDQTSYRAFRIHKTLKTKPNRETFFIFTIYQNYTLALFKIGLEFSFNARKNFPLCFVSWCTPCAWHRFTHCYAV